MARDDDARAARETTRERQTRHHVVSIEREREREREVGCALQFVGFPVNIRASRGERTQPVNLKPRNKRDSVSAPCALRGARPLADFQRTSNYESRAVGIISNRPAQLQFVSRLRAIIALLAAR